MDKDKLRNILDTVYELEALVHLAIGRDDCPNDFIRLIKYKSLTVKEKCDSLLCVADSLTEEDTEERDQNNKSDHFNVESGSMSEYSLEPPKPDREDYNEEARHENKTGEEGIAPETNIDEPSLSSYLEETKSKEKNEEPDVFPLEDLTPVYDHSEPALTSIGKDTRGHLVFSINDRYRFKRGLFANSDADFNNTLALVASMENYEEAEDYFINELGMDDKRSEVIDFLKIIRQYFNE